MKRLIPAAVTAALVGIALVGCTTDTPSDPSVEVQSTPVASATHTTAPKAKPTVEYKVKAAKSGAATVSYTTASGSESNDLDGKTFHKTYLRTDEFSIYSVTVTSTSMGKGTVTCQILVDGKSVSKHTSKGQFATASCSGSAF